MPSINDVGLNQVFSFEVYPTNVIGNNFRNVRLEATLSADTARTTGFDIYAYHTAVYPTLPPGTPDDPGSYDYIKVKFPNGEFAIVAKPWIRQDTVQISAASQVTLIFENKTEVDVERMLNALSANGFRPDDVRKAV